MATESLTVYSRSYCHLCEDMITALRELQGRCRFRLDVVDVDSDPALESRYGDKVPVLVRNGDELCHYRLEASVITALLADFR